MRCLLVVVVFYLRGFVLVSNTPPSNLNTRMTNCPTGFFFLINTMKKRIIHYCWSFMAQEKEGVTINHNFFMAVRHFKLPLFDPNTQP